MSTTIVNKIGVNRYHTIPHVGYMRPVPSIANCPFKANTLREVGEWIIKQNFGAFQGWTLDDVQEDAHEECMKWKGEIKFKSRKGNAYKIKCDCTVLNPVKPKSFGAMNDAEKMEAMAKALAKSGITI